MITLISTWAIRPKEAEEAASDPMGLSVKEALHLHAIKAEMLCAEDVVVLVSVAAAGGRPEVEAAVEATSRVP